MWGPNKPQGAELRKREYACTYLRLPVTKANPSVHSLELGHIVQKIVFTHVGSVVLPPPRAPASISASPLRSRRMRSR